MEHLITDIEYLDFIEIGDLSKLACLIRDELSNPSTNNVTPILNHTLQIISSKINDLVKKHPRLSNVEQDIINRHNNKKFTLDDI